MPERPLRIGSRGSPLALRQAQIVAILLAEFRPDISTEIVPISTEGDRRRDVPIASLGEGAFVRTLEVRLLDGHIDAAVHSLKDLPATQEGPANLLQVAFPERADPREALVSRSGARLAELVPGARVATGSPRRIAQLWAARPDLQPVEIRGNVDTRLKKLWAGHAEALLLARAGLLRLGREADATELLPPEVITPAPGQGVLVVQCRADDHRTRERLEPLDRSEVRLAAQAERAVLRYLGGGCQLPVGAYGQIQDGRLSLLAVLASPDGQHLVRLTREGPADSATQLGTEVATALAARAEGFLHLAASQRV